MSKQPSKMSPKELGKELALGTSDNLSKVADALDALSPSDLLTVFMYASTCATSTAKKKRANKRYVEIAKYPAYIRTRIKFHAWHTEHKKKFYSRLVNHLKANKE